MKKDTEVKIFMQQRTKGKTQLQAAARAGMSERTARKYEKATSLNSPVNIELERTLLNRIGPGWFNNWK